MATFLISLALYWVFFFVVVFVVTDSGQDYLYNDKVRHMGLRVLVASLLFALPAAWANMSLSDMFTTKLAWTFGIAVYWFVVFLFLLEFQLPHAAAVGIVTMLLTHGFAGMAVQGLLKGEDQRRIERGERYSGPRAPVRKSAQPALIADPAKKEQEKAAPPPAP